MQAGRQRVLSCLTLALAVRDPVTTVEGLAGDAAIRRAKTQMEQA